MGVGANHRAPGHIRAHVCLSMSIQVTKAGMSLPSFIPGPQGSLASDVPLPWNISLPNLSHCSHASSSVNCSRSLLWPGARLPQLPQHPAPPVRALAALPLPGGGWRRLSSPQERARLSAPRQPLLAAGSTASTLAGLRGGGRTGKGHPDTPSSACGRIQVEQHLQVEEVRLRPAVGRGRRPLPVTEGLVEVRLPDGWSQVCDHGWSAQNSHVVCGMLGFPGEKRVNTAFYR